MNIAIVGATGNVGRKILEVLEKKNFPIDNLYFVASSKSAGSKLKFKGKDIEVENLENFDFSKANITFFSAGGKISEKYATTAAKHSIVIDNSSHFRMDPDVPLIVPQVNSKDLNSIKKNIIANPNCSTAQLVIVLKPLHDLFKIKRVVISTYQSTSGAGKAPMDELVEQTKLSLENKKITSRNFTKQIAFNAIPHIDMFVNLIKKNIQGFYLSNETLKRSKFQNIKKSDIINLELPMKYGQNISGHICQGHVDCVSKLKRIKMIDKSYLMEFSTNNTLRKNLIEKASILINGVSLTISKITKNGFLNSIEGMIRNTNYEARKTDDYKNEGTVNEINTVLTYKSSLPLKKEKINLYGKVFDTKHFVILSKRLHKEGSEERRYDVWLDINNNHILKMTYSKYGLWE